MTTSVRLTLVCASLFAGCGSTPAPEPAPETETEAAKGEVHAAYVLLTSTPLQAWARVIVADKAAGCPTVEGGDAPIEMGFRDNPHGFSVEVCEARVPLDKALTVSWTGAALPVAKATSSRIAVLGDTGCKSKDCATGPAVPFDSVATAAAAQKPDVVLHGGDANYRGTGHFNQDGRPEYDAGDIKSDDPMCAHDLPYVSMNGSYSTDRDKWDNWKNDLFDPAAPLMAAAPWIPTRGNHELCSRAGPGWFFFLDPSVSTANGGAGQLSCPDQGGEPLPTSAAGHIITRPVDVVDLGTLRVAVADSANLCDGFAPAVTTDPVTKALAGIPAADKPLWLLSHRPSYGVGREEGATEWALDGLGKRTAVEASGTDFDLLIAGHMHLFQANQVPGKPPQLVVGNSGVKTYDSGLDETFSVTASKQPVVGFDTKEHGFMMLSATADSWSGELVSPAGEVMASCAPSATDAPCKPAETTKP